MNCIASIHKGRFGVWVKSLSKKLDKSGTFINAYNKSTKESCVHCWSSHERDGKKLFWTRVLVDTKGGRKTMSFLCLIITMLDLMHVIGLIEFCMANHGLIGFMVIIRFVQIFTCVLINIYHLWIDSGTKKENRKNTSWLQFCAGLAFEMIKQNLSLMCT